MCNLTIKNLSHAVFVKIAHRAVMLSVKRYAKTLCNPRMKTSLVKLQHLWRDKKRRTRWPEAFQSINFLHSRRKTWSIVNNLTGSSRHSSIIVPFQLTPQLLRNGNTRELIASLFISY